MPNKDETGHDRGDEFKAISVPGMLASIGDEIRYFYALYLCTTFDYRTTSVQLKKNFVQIV